MNSFDAKNIDIIVSRHPAAISFVAQKMNGSHHVTNNTMLVDLLSEDDRYWKQLDAEANGDEYHGMIKSIPIYSQVTEEQVAGKVVVGNLPLNLAAKCKKVYAIEFSGPPPRGQEYTLQDMVSCGAKLTAYKVEEQ